MFGPLLPTSGRCWPLTGTRTGQAVGRCVVAVALIVIAGWVLDVAVMRGAFLGLVAVRPNTAIGLLALATALLLTTSKLTPTTRRIARLLAGLAILIGVLTTAEYLLGQNLAIDQLVFPDHSGLTAHSGRPAPQTAIILMSLGWALLLLLLRGKKTRSRLVGALAGGSFLLAMSAVIGDTFGVSGLDGPSGMAPIAPLTAVAFLFLCAGIAASDPDGVFVAVLTSDAPGSVVARRLLPLAVVLLPVIGWLGLQGQRHGLFSPAEGAALRVLASTVVLALAVLSLTKRLNRLDLERKHATATAVRLAALVDAANEAIISADPDSIITTWNRAAEKLYGYPAQQIIGRPASILSPPDKIAEQRRLIVAAARGDAITECDTQRLHKDGSLLNLSVTLSPIMHAGSLTGFCAVQHDIGDRLRTRNTLENEIGKRTRQLRRSRAETLHKLALAAEYRDDDTSQHTERVGAGAAELATRLGLPGSMVRLIRHAAPLHDVGKIGIPDRILLKPGPLNPHEFAAIKQHTILGAGLLNGSDSAILQLGEQIALTHHERWDGSGYPAGLAAEAIPIAGRIVAVVDSFDAMAYDRPYRAGSSVEAALSEVARCSGTQFDPRVVKAFLELRHHGAPPTESEPNTPLQLRSPRAQTRPEAVRCASRSSTPASMPLSPTSRATSSRGQRHC
jgi:PAS domain S-box-containing protein